jgi:beta-lactamase regulating signal transducer with metallopeptidase domain
MFFSLVIPFIHISLNVSNINKYEYPIKEIGKIRSYYEQLIAMTDPEYELLQFNQNNMDFEEFEYNKGDFSNPNNKTGTLNIGIKAHPEIQKSKITIAQVLFVLYIIGAIVFFTRIILLFRWIYKTISRNKVDKRNKIKLVEVNENLPPFSFLSYVFLNKDLIIENKADQILSHEEVHIKQKHTIDLLLAHFLTIFHWFNPIAWLLQKAIKTNHEYIADSEVVNKGCDLLDYQELLLSQFVSIPSVELVNNFNLISIKNRIAMMNKIKSGFSAKLKAFLIIPFAIIVFLLFSNLTLNGPSKVLNNFSFFENQVNIEQVKGLWKNENKDTYGYLIKFTENKLSILENQVQLKVYDYKIKDNNLILNQAYVEPIELKFQITNNKIKIWWNDLNSSEFTKSYYDNSLDVFLTDKKLKIIPPTIKIYRRLERLELCLFVAIHGNKVIVQDQVGEFADLEKLLIEEKSKFNQLNLNIVTIQLAVDENTEMKQVYELQQILRKNNLLKIGYVCYPDDNAAYLYPPTAFTRMLPPINVEEVKIEDLVKKSIEFFEIDATDIENNVEIIKPKLTKFISESEKYVIGLTFDNSTSYKTYSSYNDMVFSIMLDFRNQYALEKYNIEYKSLGKELQREVRKKYPIILSQHNNDEEESQK